MLEAGVSSGLWIASFFFFMIYKLRPISPVLLALHLKQSAASTFLQLFFPPKISFSTALKTHASLYRTSFRNRQSRPIITMPSRYASSARSSANQSSASGCTDSHSCTSKHADEELVDCAGSVWFCCKCNQYTNNYTGKCYNCHHNRCYYCKA